MKQHGGSREDVRQSFARAHIICNLEIKNAKAILNLVKDTWRIKA